MQFRSPDETPRRITAGIGAWLIGRDWVSVPPHADASAYAAGCISKAMTTSSASKQAQVSMGEGLTMIEAEKAQLRTHILAWYRDPVKHSKRFTKANLPSLTALGNVMGHTVHSGQVREVCHSVRTELGIRKGDLVPVSIESDEG